jgi:lysophospholipase L1-like esterase
MKTCIFGDSVTYGGYVKGSWVSLLREYLEGLDDESHVVFNLGINGNTSTDVLRRFKPEATARTAEKIIFAYGTNDAAYTLANNIPVTDIELFKSNTITLISQAKEFTNDITFVGTTLGDDSKLKPYSESKTGRCYSRERADQYNQAIQLIAEQNGCKFISLDNKLDFSDFSDGLHPNESGHKKIYETVVAKFFS